MSHIWDHNYLFETQTAVSCTSNFPPKMSHRMTQEMLFTLYSMWMQLLEFNMNEFLWSSAKEALTLTRVVFQSYKVSILWVFPCLLTHQFLQLHLIPCLFQTHLGIASLIPMKAKVSLWFKQPSLFLYLTVMHFWRKSQ